MICVSSFRALKNCSTEILRNQLRARESWDDAFSHIYYFGDYEPRLAGPNVTFFECADFPTIKEMIRVIGLQQQWGAFINADIVLGKGLKIIHGELAKRGALCAMSRRFEFQGEDVNSGRMLDNGLDFFCGTPSFWKLASSMIPDNYRIGHCLFDTWLLGFMCSHYYAWLWDFTECRVIFHPKHEDRQRPFKIDHNVGWAQVDQVKWPAVSRRLKIQSIAEATGTKPEHFL